MTLLDPARRRYGTGRSVIRQPAPAAVRTISSGHPDRRSLRPSSSRSTRRAARIGPRSVRTAPVRRPTAPANHQFAIRACGGQAPGSARRAPRTRSASPSTTGPATDGRCLGSIDASQSMKHTTSDSARCSPAKQAAPKPRRGSETTTAPSPRASSAEPSVDPLSTTIGRYPTGIRGSTQAMASTSSSTGRTTSITWAPPSRAVRTNDRPTIATPSAAARCGPPRGRAHRPRHTPRETTR